MKKYLLKRLIISIVTLFCIVLVMFLLLNLMPGSPFQNEKLSPEQRALLLSKYGLDKSLPERFFIYLKNLLKGDFGVSYSLAANVPISDLLKAHMQISMILGFVAMVIGSLLVMSVGFFSALAKDCIGDKLCSVLTIIGISLPSYLFSIFFSYTLGFRTGTLPMLFEHSHPVLSSIMPVLSYALPVAAVVCRFTRDEAVSVMDSDYVLFAKSQGISGMRLLTGYILRNSLMPVITVIMMLLVGLLSGSMVTEQIFSIPGIGALLTKAITANDYNVVLALTFVFAFIFIAARLLLDVLYGIIDPRIRVSGKG